VRRPALAGMLALAGAALAVAAPPALAGASHPGTWSPGPAQYGMSSYRTDVRMSDGIELSATVTEPTDPATGQPATGRFPAIVAITPYAKDEPCLDCASPDQAGIDTLPAPYFVPYGYVYVLVDVRGTGSSGGDFQLMGPREVQDGIEVIHWAARLAHSSGRVGMAGESYLGLDQLAIGGAIGPRSPLKALFPVDVGVDDYRDLAVPGGMFNNLFDTPYAGLEISMDTLGPLTSGHSLDTIVQDLGLHLAGNAEIDGRTLTDAFDGGDRAYDHQFWADRDLSSATSRIPGNGIGVFAYNALFDIWQRGDGQVYSILQNAAAHRPPFGPMSPRQRPDPRFQVVLGPYTHGYVPPGERWLALEWFDTWLKGRKTGMDRTTPPLHSYEIEGGRWVDSPTWPPPPARARTFYFAGGGSGSGAPSRNDGTLRDAPPGAGTDEVFWNGGLNVPCSRPTDQEFIQGQVKAFNDQFGNRWENPCTYDDRGLEIGALTYTTDPLREPATIAGPGNVTIYAAANTPNTEWVVTLDDVAPDGSARPLSTGDLIGSLRATDPARAWRLDGRTIMSWHPYTRGSELAVPPGGVERYEVELPATVARIARGHRIRVTVQTSYSPYLEPQLPHQFQLMGGDYLVQRGGAAASSVTLPMLWPGNLRTSPVEWGACVTDCGERDPSAEVPRDEAGPVGCRASLRLALRAPRLRRGERIRSLAVRVNGRRVRARRRRGAFVVALPRGRARVIAVWRTTRGRTLVTRRTLRPCRL
jgi:putative CocE/NonD family hydrolase